MSQQQNNKPKHLGRGLQSLLSSTSINSKEDAKQPIPIANVKHNSVPDKELHNSLREISIERIKPNPFQPRTNWDEGELDDLVASIKANGLIQPIIVRPVGPDFELIAGERRFRASQRAGLEKIPAMVRLAKDEQMLELALVENIHRQDLNPIERARAYQRYISTFKLTQENAAQRLGENRTVVTNYMRLLELPEDIKQMLISGELSMGHARAILSLPTDELRRKLANRAMAGRLSVREVERLVRKYTMQSKKPKSVKEKAPHIVDLEQQLTNELGTRVNVETKRGGKRGKIVIDFYSLDDFDRITEKLGLAAHKTQ